jgi:F-type H+-transporting ATPase subunit b
MLSFNPLTILFTLANLLILWLFLKKFLFGKVNALLDQRAKAIQDEKAAAAAALEQAESTRKQYDGLITQAQAESAALLARSKDAAQREYDNVVSHAQKDAKQILDTGRKQLSAERDQMIRGARREVAELALLAAAKVAQKELDAQGDLALVDAFLRETGGHDE